MKLLYTWFILLFPIILSAQTYNTIAEGDIESPQVWQNGNIPPFQFSGTSLEIPSTLILNINHEISTTKSDIINRGVVNIIYDEYDDPSACWINFGNMELTGWSPDRAKFINQPSGQILFLSNGSFCQHTGCGSENYGTIYVNTCLSNICAYDSSSRFINHENARILLCEDGYIENYWRLPNAGSLDNLSIINNGAIIYDDSWATVPVYNLGNDFFNGNPNSMGMFTGNNPYDSLGIDCLSQLPDLTTSIEYVKDETYLNIFPNPTRSTLNIQSDVIVDLMKILNTEGKLVLTQNIEKLNSKIALNIPDGIYFIQFHLANKKVTTEKIIVSNY